MLVLVRPQAVQAALRLHLGPGRVVTPVTLGVVLHQLRL